MGKRLNHPYDHGQTPLDDISGLIPKHITTREALNRAEFANITKAHSRYFLGRRKGRTKPFSYGWFLKLHKDMFGEVWDWAGKIRKTGLSLGRPVAKIGSDLHELVYDLHQWEKNEMDILEIAVRLHHRLVWIHPFSGGNGRWARTASNLYLFDKGLGPLAWPDDQMMIESRLRKDYIAALKQADAGDYDALVHLHRRFSKSVSR